MFEFNKLPAMIRSIGSSQFYLTLLCVSTLSAVPSSSSAAVRNLALGQPAKAKSTQTSHDPGHAVDGNLKSRWCANGSQESEWWEVQLAETASINAVRILWEQEGTAYRYLIESSLNGNDWKTVVDRSENTTETGITTHQFDPVKANRIRVTFLGSNSGGWGSISEFAAYSGDPPPEFELVESSTNVTVADVNAPDGFNVRLFGVPPEINYPVCLTADYSGDVFIGVDEQGSLGKEAGRGKVLRGRDTNGDGTADEVQLFAKMDHPRGLFYDDNSLWVLHPPFLTVFHDRDGDGTADEQQTLIEGISTDFVNKRGADHTTNGIRMGIDGWLYIAVGDFGFTHAVGADGTELSRRGGGIVRVRPDGSEMEIYCWGLRNILDVSIDPFMNIFTRDNTNDGGEWNVRLSHILQSAEFGYPSLFMNYTDEIMPPLADYGGGSGCGTFFLHDAQWPENYNNTLYTCDWGRSEVFLHNLPESGPTYLPHQQSFLRIPRPTDIDIDAAGRMYVSSWKNGNFAYDGPDVGFVAQIVPDGLTPAALPDLKKLDDTVLVSQLRAGNMKQRLYAQREILRRDEHANLDSLLTTLMNDPDGQDFARVAALYTLKQLRGVESHPELLEALTDPLLREHALRALTDRRTEFDGVTSAAIIPYLSDPSPRVVAQAIISLGRLGDSSIAENLIPLTVRQSDTPRATAHNVADADAVIPHLAIRALVNLQAGEACLQALDTPYRDGAIQALRWMHDPVVVTNLIERLQQASDAQSASDLLSVLVRLYHREGDYKEGWWGTRPDRTGPYYDRQPWEETARIEEAIVSHYQSADEIGKERLLGEMIRHRVHPSQLPKSLFEDHKQTESNQPIAIPTVDPDNPNQIANMTFEEVLERTLNAEGNVKRGRRVFLQQSCIACHTYTEGQDPKGPHLADIGKRYTREQLIESILKPSAKIAQGFDTYSFITTEGKIYSGFIVGRSAEEVKLRQANGLSQTILQNEIEEQVQRTESMMPQGIVNNLTPEELAHLLAFLEQLK
ncbi:discoidin domain-containing protein [Thalassoglobus sp. JC818]|uniref:DUF7133 domain-containing protein n=1 Tax=Thalassoglobus sp. JC818 TaxID=3232136 RepID=UPI00345B31CC